MLKVTYHDKVTGERFTEAQFAAELRATVPLALLLIVVIVAAILALN